DAVGDVGMRHLFGELIGGTPARAVRRDDGLGADLGQGINGRSDDWFEGWPGQVEAAYDGGDGVDAGESACVADDIDDAGVAASGEDHEPMTGNVDHQGLVIEDQRGGCPGAVNQRLMERHAVFKATGSVDLAGNEHRVVE